MKRTFVVTGDDYDRVAKWIATQYPSVEVFTPLDDPQDGRPTTLVTCFCTCNLFWSGAEKVITPDPFWGVLLPILDNKEVEEQAWRLRLDPLVYADEAAESTRDRRG